MADVGNDRGGKVTVKSLFAKFGNSNVITSTMDSDKQEFIRNCQCCFEEVYFGKEFPEENDMDSFVDTIDFCFSVKIVPTCDKKRLICNLCIDQLKESFKLKRSIVESQERFTSFSERGLSHTFRMPPTPNGKRMSVTKRAVKTSKIIAKLPKVIYASPINDKTETQPSNAEMTRQYASYIRDLDKSANTLILNKTRASVPPPEVSSGDPHVEIEQTPTHVIDDENQIDISENEIKFDIDQDSDCDWQRGPRPQDRPRPVPGGVAKKRDRPGRFFSQIRVDLVRVDECLGLSRNGDNASVDISSDDSLSRLSSETRRLHSKLKPVDVSKDGVKYFLRSDIDALIVCPACNKIMFDLPTLSNHLYTHVMMDSRFGRTDQNARVPCPVCFNSHEIESIQESFSNHLNEAKTCTLCKKTVFFLKRHWCDMAKQFIMAYECDSCGELFATKKKRIQHIFFVHNPHPPLSKCGTCFVLFTSEEEYNQHFKKRHS